MLDHPLKVYYPFGGQHYLLAWKVYYDGTHIILSKTFSGLCKTLEKVLNKHGYSAEFVSVQTVDLVAPYNELCERAIKLEKERRANQFYYEVIGWLRYNLEENKISIPEPFKFCDQNHDKYCETCDGTTIISAISQEELYDFYHDKWNSVFNYDKRIIKTKVPQAQYSRAAMADPSKSLYYASAHVSGVYLGLVEDCLSSEVLFFYQNQLNLNEKEEETISSFFKKIEEQENSRRKKIKEQKNEEMEKRKKEERQIIIKALDIFKQ